MAFDLRRLDRAGRVLARSVRTVRREVPLAPAAPPPARPAADVPPPAHLRPSHRETALDQTVAALQAVVWIAAFVQSIFDEIRGRAD